MRQIIGLLFLLLIISFPFLSCNKNTFSADVIIYGGTGDDKIQPSYFRLCMSNHPENRVPLEKPEGYDPAGYELLARVFESGWNEWSAKYNIIPNRKTDTQQPRLLKDFHYPSRSHMVWNYC